MNQKALFFMFFAFLAVAVPFLLFEALNSKSYTPKEIKTLAINPNTTTTSIKMKTSITVEEILNQQLISTAEQLFNTNTWIWNGFVLQQSSIMSIEPTSGDLEFEAIVFYSSKNTDKIEEHFKCLIFIKNKSVFNIPIEDYYDLVKKV
jgi:hypothetical protein